MITPDPDTGLLHLPRPSFVFGHDDNLTLEWTIGHGDQSWSVHVDWGRDGISATRTYGQRDTVGTYSVIMDETVDWATVVRWLSQEPEGFDAVTEAS